MRRTAAATGQRPAVLALVGLTAMFGFSGVLVRVLSGAGLSLLQQLYLRGAVALLVGLLVLGPVPVATLRALPPVEWLLLALRGVGGFLVASVLFGAAVLHTSLAHVSLIASLPLVVVLGVAVYGDRFPAAQAAGSAGAVAGVLLVFVPAFGGLSGWNRGDLYALLHVLTLSLVLVGRRHHSGVLSSTEISMLTVLFGTVAALMASFVTEPPPTDVDWGAVSVAALVTYGLFAGLNTVILNYAFDRLSSVVAGNLLLLEVAFGVLFGLWVYGEVPTPWAVAGGLVIVTSVGLINMVPGGASGPGGVAAQAVNAAPSSAAGPAARNAHSAAGADIGAER